MKNILLPTDFSRSSKNAVDYALQLFKNELCTFYFLHVQKISNYTTDDLMTTSTETNIYNVVLFNAKKELKEYVNLIRIKHRSDTHVFKQLIDYDSFTDAIKQAITSKNIDLIVMGTNGATGASQAIFGSNTLNVIRKINCPTITVPFHYSYTPPSNILFVTDKNNAYNAKILEPLTDIYMKFNSTITILNTIKKNDLTTHETENLEKTRAHFKKNTYPIHHILNAPLSDTINSLVTLSNINLLSLIIKKESFLYRLFKGSITSDICYGSHIPLLFLHQD